MVNGAPNRAVCRFKEAEQYLPAIQDRFEAAEFYYKTAGAYYMMKSPALSIQYVNKALEIYQGEFGYIKKTLSCRLLLAVNYIDEARYEDAEQLFNESIKITDRINDNNLLCHAYYNFGFLKTAQKKDKEALLFTKRYWAISVSRKSLPFPTCIVYTKRSEHFLKPDMPPKDKPCCRKVYTYLKKCRTRL